MCIINGYVTRSIRVPWVNKGNYIAMLELHIPIKRNTFILTGRKQSSCNIFPIPQSCALAEWVHTTIIQYHAYIQCTIPITKSLMPLPLFCHMAICIFSKGKSVVMPVLECGIKFGISGIGLAVMFFWFHSIV